MSVKQRKSSKTPHTPDKNGVIGKVCTGKVCGGAWLELELYGTWRAAWDLKMTRCPVCRAAAKALSYERNPNLGLGACMRSRVLSALNGTPKAGRTMKLVGCTVDELRRHLESQFREGMSWGNHGQFGWHIDHIRPCSSFDLTDPDQQRACFHYSNVRPLWWWENLSKGSKVAM